MVQSPMTEPTDKPVCHEVWGPNWWTQTQDCGGGLGGRDRAEDGLQGGGDQEQAGTQAHHGGSSEVSFIDSRVAQ